MELTSKYFNIEIDTNELIRRLPDGVMSKVEKQLLEDAKEKFGEHFTGIDFVDQEGDKLMFGVFN